MASHVHGGALVIDCATCPVRELHCADCMVTTLRALPEPGLPLDADERAVVTGLVRAGLLSAESAASARARSTTAGAGPVRETGRAVG